MWVSALLNPDGAPSQVLTAWRAGRFTVVASDPLVAELEMVLARPRIVRRFTLGRDVFDLALYLRQHAEFVEVTGSVQLCRDPRDDIFIETAQRGKADVLVSRDEDLTRDLDLHARLAQLGLRALPVRQFLLSLEGG